jgi:predicted nucleotidyltransferase
MTIPVKSLDRKYHYLCIMNIVEKNIDIINDICKRHKVRQMFIFGSVLTKKFRNNSDIDLLVDFQGVDLYDYADNYFDLKYSLEKLFNREVDLLEDKAITNPFLRQTIDSSKQLIYG